jgi:hypothetical protein
MTQWIIVKHPKLKRDYIGKMVRTKRDMRNQMVAIRKGTIAIVKWRPRTGAELTTDPCACCGLMANISGVQDHDIEFVERACVEAM